MAVEDLGPEEGMEGIAAATKVALIDADTIIYAACSGNEYAEDMLGEEMYTPEEWNSMLADPQYDATEHCVWRVDMNKVIESAKERISEIQTATFTKSVELYFSHGPNFRHLVDTMYKANRGSTRYPPGLLEGKLILAEEYAGEICDGVEADDAVVYLKRVHPEKYVLVAVDKDVLNAVPGKHYNYYRSVKYSIAPKWVIITKEHAEKWFYVQVLMGDSTDNIRGCPGIGPKKAEKALIGKETPYERWSAVVELFKSKNLTEKDAIKDARLINMHQVTLVDGKYKWEPWTPPLP